MSPEQAGGVPPVGPGQTLARWTGDEKLKIGAGTIITAAGVVGGIIQALNSVRDEAEKLPQIPVLQSQASWVVWVAVAILGTWMCYLGSRKQSRLLRPEALVLRADDPTHLRSREVDQRPQGLRG